MSLVSRIPIPVEEAEELLENAVTSLEDISSTTDEAVEQIETVSAALNSLNQSEVDQLNALLAMSGVNVTLSIANLTKQLDDVS